MTTRTTTPLSYTSSTTYHSTTPEPQGLGPPPPIRRQRSPSTNSHNSWWSAEEESPAPRAGWGVSIATTAIGASSSPLRKQETSATMGAGTPGRKRGQFSSYSGAITVPSSSSSSSSGATIRPHYQLHYNPNHHHRHHHHHHPTSSASPASITTPSFSFSSSSSTSSHTSTHPISPTLPYNTPIDWKGNAARRAEYAALDRRRQGVAGLFRRAAAAACCFGRAGGEFWEEKCGDDGGSVRRYRLALPAEEEDEDEDLSPARVGEGEKGGTRIRVWR